MTSILLWAGIALTVAGWLALGWQASKWMAARDKMQKFPEMKKRMFLHRNYCRLTILIGIALIITSIIL